MMDKWGKSQSTVLFVDLVTENGCCPCFFIDRLLRQEANAGFRPFSSGESHPVVKRQFGLIRLSGQRRCRNAFQCDFRFTRYGVRFSRAPHGADVIGNLILAGFCCSYLFIAVFPERRVVSARPERIVSTRRIFKRIGIRQLH